MFGKALVMGALALVAAAQSSTLSFTHVPNPITIGKAQTITYTTTDDSAPVSIILRKGESTDLNTIATLTSNAKNGQYVWTPSASLANGVDYALEIVQGNQNNYYGPFAIQGGSSESSSSSRASASASASSLSSSALHSAAGYATLTASQNGTAITTATASYGTGTAIMSMSRNTTMSRATLTGSGSASQTRSSHNPASTDSGAGFQGTQTSSTSVPQSTGGAASLMTTGSSAIALVFGAVAAVFFF